MIAHGRVLYIRSGSFSAGRAHLSLASAVNTILRVLLIEKDTWYSIVLYSHELTSGKREREFGCVIFGSAYLQSMDFQREPQSKHHLYFLDCSFFTSWPT